MPFWLAEEDDVMEIGVKSQDDKNSVDSIQVGRGVICEAYHIAGVSAFDQMFGYFA